MKYYLYILKTVDNTLYCGIARDVIARFNEHLSGKGAKYTKGRGPVELVYYEKYEDKSTAMRREWEMKQLSRREKERIIKKEVTNTREACGDSKL